jgi:hypothetical protein
LGGSQETSSTAGETSVSTSATAGAYNVGDIGPGGGVVFYLHQNGTFTSTGSDCGANCKYLEFAPADLEGDLEAVFEWCSDTTSLLDVAATGIGSGMANTTTAANTCASGAIQVAAEYVNNGKTDWHLPSRDEFNELCKYAWSQATGDTSVDCYYSGSLRSGFSADYYWSSSEASATSAWVQIFGAGIQNYTNKTFASRVRPVRAF